MKERSIATNSVREQGSRRRRSGSFLFRRFALVCAGLAATAAFAQDSPELFREIPAAGLSAEAGAVSNGPTVVRSRFVEIDMQRLFETQDSDDAAPRPGRARTGASNRLTFNLFTDAVHEFEQEGGAYSPDGTSFTWTGSTTQTKGGHAILTVRDGHVAGNVRTAAGEFYRIRSINPSVHVIRQVTYQGSPAEEDAVPVPEGEIPQAAMLEQNAPVAEQSGTTTLDVMIVYTAAARQAAGGTTAIQSEINLAIAELNQSFSNSGVQMEARLAHSAELGYNQDGVSLSTTLSRLRTPNDGYLEQAHTLRDQYGADVVALLVNGPGSGGGTVGTGYIMQTVGSYFASYAFSVTEVNFATGPSYALLHEIGHNLGAAHDRNNASNGGAYSYSYGYQRAQSPRFRTIMAYNCSGANCPTINRWSNPNATYQGYPTGVSSSQSNSADNRLTLNNTRTTAAAWRQGGQNTQHPPSAVSVSPSSGNGSSRTFTYNFSDGNGYADIPAVEVLINDSLDSQNACYLYFSRRYNLLYLMNNNANTWLGPINIGSSQSLQNSQCSVNGSQSSFSGSGNGLTVAFALTFESSFAGTKTNYMIVRDLSGLDSGWRSRGTWTVPGATVNTAPQAVSVSPSSGTSDTQVFTYSFSDSNGYEDIPAVQMLINSSFSMQNACHLYFSRRYNLLYLLNNTANAWLGPINIGSSQSLQNSQCQVSGSQSSYSGSGNNLTVRLALSFNAAFSGTKSNYMIATDLAGLYSNWQGRGSWTVPGASSNAPPQTVGVSPSSGTGSSQTFTYTFSDSNGYDDIPAVQMLINNSFSMRNACHLYFSRRYNLLYLLNDEANTWIGPINIGSSNFLQNGQCQVSGSQSSFSNSGSTLTVRLVLEFRPGFGGAKINYMYVNDLDGLHSNWQAQGTWNVPGSSVGAVSRLTER